MRAYDLALMLAIFAAVLGVLDECVLFTGADISTGPDIITKEEFDDIQTIGADGTESDLGIIAKTAKSAFEGIMFLLRVLGRIVWIVPIIVSVFGGSTEAESIAYIIQVGIWLTYAIAMFQAWSKTSIAGMQ